MQGAGRDGNVLKLASQIIDYLIFFTSFSRLAQQTILQGLSAYTYLKLRPRNRQVKMGS